MNCEGELFVIVQMEVYVIALRCLRRLKYNDMLLVPGLMLKAETKESRKQYELKEEFEARLVASCDVTVMERGENGR